VDTPALRDDFKRPADPQRSLIERTRLGRIGQTARYSEGCDLPPRHTQLGHLTGEGLTVDRGVLAQLRSE